MAYIINRFDGTQLAVIDDGVLNTSSSLGLIGRNYTGYGETQNENFIWLLENFSNPTPPSKPLSGQIWYDSTNSVLKVYNGTDWLAIGNAVVAEIEPPKALGALWYNAATQQLYVSDGTSWKLIGPEGVEGFDTTKATSTLITDSAGTGHPVIMTQVDGEILSIYTKQAFTINPSEAILGFNELQLGLNLRSDNKFVGDLAGNAATTSRLKNPIRLNGVSIDGSQDTVIKASTTKRLIRGTYLTGSTWDGSIEDTWAVDATPENLVGKVVARDSTGSFSASTVSANIFGDVVGNIVSVSGTSIISNLNAETITGKTFSGNSATATKFQVPARINTVLFDGTADITLPVPAGTLTGTALATNVVTSSLRTLGSLTSLATENAGITVGPVGGITLSLPDGSTPTIKTVNGVGLNLSTVDAVVGLIPGSKSLQLGAINKPALVPYNADLTLGIAPLPWKTTYSKAFIGDALDIKTITNSQGNVVVNGSLSVTNVMSGNVIGNVTGNLQGNVTGNVTGSASLNVLKTGDTLSGNLNWVATEQGLSWAMNSDGASIKFYNTSDGDVNSRLEFNTGDNGNEYFRWTHSLSGQGTFEAMRLVPNNFGTSLLTVTGTAAVSGTVLAGTFSGRGNLITDIDATAINAGKLSAARLSGAYNIDITGNASTATNSQNATNVIGGNVNAASITSGNATFNGTISTSPSGIITADLNVISNRINSGFFQTSTPTVANGWPVNGSWYHLLSSSHTNPANYYSMQFAGDFYNSNNVYYRATAGNGTAAWNKMIHAGNYTEVTVTKTGSGASGLWPIAITGNAATVTTLNSPQIVSALGFTPVNPSNLTNQRGTDIVGATGTFSQVLNVSTAGIRFPNDAFGGGLDTASITLETKGGEATTMAFRITNDADDTIGFFAPSNDGVTINNNVVLHAGNWSNYAPTKTGSGASGTWAIGITGNSATVTTLNSQQIVSALGYTPTRTSDLTNQSGTAIAGTTGTFSNTLNVAAGSTKGIRFPNDAFGGSGDTATITLETKSGEATSLTFRVTNDADDTINFYAPVDSGVKINNNTVLHAANYYFYSPSLTGGNASGTWAISITGNANTVTTLGKQQVIDALGYTPVSTTNNPTSIFNQGRINAEADGYREPANQLTLRDVYSNNYPTSYGNVITVGGEGGGELLIGWSSTTGAHANNYIRSRRDTGNTWSPWAKVVTDANISDVMSGLTGYGFQITYGQSAAPSFTNRVWYFDDSANFIDVFPPAGKTMANLVGFIPSINKIYFAGGVNGDDALRCEYVVLTDRVRVYVQNSEQRYYPAANWLAIWRQ